MSYTPVNSQIFFAAYSGALAGMVVSNRVPTDTNAASTANVGNAAVAGAFAQSFDTAWANAADANLLDVLATRHMCSMVWESRAPQALVTPSLTPSSYTTLCNALIAIIGAATTYMSGQGIAIPANGGGSGGVDVEDEGIALGNFTTLNFVGGGVTATDAGGGVADVTVPAVTSVAMVGDVTGNSAANTVERAAGSGGLFSVTGTAMAIGATPATTGTIRLPNNNDIVARNAANTADAQLLRLSAGDACYVGNSANLTGVRFQPGGAANPVFDVWNNRAQINSGFYIGVGAAAGSATGLPATGNIRMVHSSSVTGRNGADTTDRNLYSWGVTADTFILGDVNNAMQLNASLIQLGTGAQPSAGSVRIGNASWSMIARNNADSANCNIIRSNPTANTLILGDTVWGGVTVQGPSVQCTNGTSSISVGTTGLNISGTTATNTQINWLTTTIAPQIVQSQAAGSVAGLAMLIRAQAGGATGNQNGGSITLEGGVPTGTGTKGGVILSGGSLTFTTPVAATASAGGGAAPPATVEEYLTVTVNGNARKIPLYLT